MTSIYDKYRSEQVSAIVTRETDKFRAEIVRLNGLITERGDGLVEALSEALAEVYRLRAVVECAKAVSEDAQVIGKHTGCLLAVTPRLLVDLEVALDALEKDPPADQKIVPHRCTICGIEEGKSPYYAVLSFNPTIGALQCRFTVPCNGRVRDGKMGKKQ